MFLLISLQRKDLRLFQSNLVDRAVVDKIIQDLSESFFQLLTF